MEQERIEIGAIKGNGTKTDHRQSDLPPEYCHYPDDGCDLAASCLKCPFNRCLYEEPGGKQRYFKRLRNREISRQHKEGKSVKKLAANFSVSERTIQRVIKGAEK